MFFKLNSNFFFQKLCDYVSDLLLEESNVQPVSTPVTVCGDIHGQVFLFLAILIFHLQEIFKNFLNEFKKKKKENSK